MLVIIIVIFIILAGLQTAYYKRKGAYHHMWKVLALPFLPQEHIRGAFGELRLESEDGDTRLSDLADYIEQNWMSNTVRYVSEWSVFMQPVSTNNDVEGWHRRLNVQARRGQLPLYMLIELLHRESKLVELQATLVSDNRLKRYQRTKYTNMQGRIFTLWDEYSEEKKDHCLSPVPSFTDQQSASDMDL